MNRLILCSVVALVGTVTFHRVYAGPQSQKDIVAKVRSAANAPTYGGAKVLLDQVNPRDITDPDLASYYAISREVADFCSDLGIARDARDEYLDIMIKIDKAAIIKRLTLKGVKNAPAEAAGLFSDAMKIRKQVPLFEELDVKLADKYGLAPAEKAIRERTMAQCVGKYRWRTTGRTIDFTLKADGTFLANDKPDQTDIAEGAGLIHEGKGTWSVKDGKLTIVMTHVWAVALWKAYTVTWIRD